MIDKIAAESIFFKDYGWHSGYFHFEFGDYKDPDNHDFGVLAALNDFSVQPCGGFEPHPHSEMEIISYCVDGVLDHQDNMGNKSTLRRGDSQYTSSGSGIIHSEMNLQEANDLRFIQIWIKPRTPELPPQYRMKKYIDSDKSAPLRHIASGEKREGMLWIAQDANIFAGQIEGDTQWHFQNHSGRQSYIYCLAGTAGMNGLDLKSLDAMKVWGEEDLIIKTREHFHVLIVEMAEG